MPFIPRYSITTNGTMTFVGNTLGLSKLINANQAGTQGSIGAFISLSRSQVPTFPIGTTLDYVDNSSQAILNIPSGSTIIYAELIWGGNYLALDQDISGLINDSITFTTPLGNNKIAPDPATANQPTAFTGTVTVGFYMRSADVTNFVQTAGGGIYSVGGVPGLVDPLLVATSDTNNAGWTLAVVYGNPTLPDRNINLFVGAQIVKLGTSVDIPLSGFFTPTTGTVNGRILLSAQEGDVNIAGDQALFGTTVGSLGILSGPNNPATNFFGSQINDDSGNLDPTGTFGTRNQDSVTLTNIVAGRQGWDITNVDTFLFLTNSQTSAVLRLSTVGDLYMPNTIGIQIDVNAPNLQPIKSVDKSFATVGDILTYTVVIPNNGLVDAANVIVTDTVPPETSFVPGSFIINGAPVLGTDLNTGVNIGDITTDGSVTVTFQVIVDDLLPLNLVVNQASMSYQYQSSIGGPVLTGYAISNQVSTHVNVAELIMVKSVDKAFATVGDILTYTAVITNQGNILASNVFFRDVPPVGTVFVSESVIIGDFPRPGLNPSIAFNLGSISPGSSVIVIFEVQIVSPPPSNIINHAQVAFNFQLDPSGPPVEGSAISNPVQTTINDIKESVCVIVEQVYDSCLQKKCDPAVVITLPSGGPFTFVNATFLNGTINNIVIMPIATTLTARFQFTVEILYSLTLMNIGGQLVTISNLKFTFNKDIVLYRPPTSSEFDLNLRVETRTVVLGTPTFRATTIELVIGSYVITKVTGYVQFEIPGIRLCQIPRVCEDFIPFNPCDAFENSTSPAFFPPLQEE